MKKVLMPVNQKSIYHSFGDLYEKMMNDEITLEKAEIGGFLLAGMNRTYALELKRAEVEHALKGNTVTTEVRSLESKGFDNTTE